MCLHIPTGRADAEDLRRRLELHTYQGPAFDGMMVYDHTRTAASQGYTLPHNLTIEVITEDVHHHRITMETMKLCPRLATELETLSVEEVYAIKRAWLARMDTMFERVIRTGKP